MDLAIHRYLVRGVVDGAIRDDEIHRRAGQPQRAEVAPDKGDVVERCRGGGAGRHDHVGAEVHPDGSSVVADPPGCLEHVLAAAAAEIDDHLARPGRAELQRPAARQRVAARRQMPVPVGDGDLEVLGVDGWRGHGFGR